MTPPCACEVCEAAYGDLRAYRAALEQQPRPTAEALAAEILERLRLTAIQLLAALKVLPYQMTRKAPRP